MQKQERRAAIQRQIKRLDAQLLDLKQTSDRLSRIRLGVFLAGVVTAVIVLMLTHVVAGLIAIYVLPSLTRAK